MSLFAAEKIKAPRIIIVAEKEESLDNALNGEKVYNAVKSRGVPAAYHVIKGITHYGVYAEGFDEATKLELEWFNQHLKPKP